MGFWFAIQVGIVLWSVAWGAYQYYSARNEKAAVAGLDPNSVPRANEGDPVPIVYGTVRIRGANIVSFKQNDISPREVVDVGLAYFMDARFVLCLSNDRVETAGTQRASFIKMYVGDKEVAGFTPSPVSVDGVSAWQVLDNDVMGGNVLGGGGRVSGGFLFFDGNWNQGAVFGDVDAQGGVSVDAGNTPNYRGFVCVKLAGWEVGLSPNVPAYSFVIHNPVTIPGYESVSGPLANGTANPAAVLYDLLTNPWGRVGNDATLVDIESFAAAAATLQDEQHGISLVVSAANEARTIVEQVLKQIDAVVYEDPATRRYKLYLIREDYDEGDLPVFDPSNILEAPSMPSTLWEETVNEVRVIFTNPVSGYQEGVAPAQDLALINAQGGRRRTAELRMPGVTTAQLAYYLAQRELNFLSRPIAKLELVVNREGYDLHPGQPFRFNWPEWNYTGIFRVEQPSTGTLEDGRVTFAAVQDRFSIAGVSFPPPDEIGPSVPTPDPIQLRTITEAPRWIMLKAFEAGTLTNVDAQRGYYLARPEGSDSRYKVQASLGGGAEIQDAPARAFPAGFTVDLAYARTTSAYDVTTGLRIRGLYGTTLAAATATEIATLGRNLIQVNGEIMAFESVTDLGGGDWLLEDVWRGLLDTVPANHADGDQGYFLPGSYAGAALGALVLVHGTAVATHTQAAAGSSWTPSPEGSPDDAFVARSRTLLSYPGSDLKLQTTKTPAALEEGGVTIEWKGRDRLKGTISRGDAAIETVEGGTAYDAVATKDGGAEIVCASGHASSSAVQVPLGAAGHGLLEVGARTKRTVALPDGTTPTLYNWQTPKLDLQAHHWRNLLRNPRFADGLNYWDLMSGTAAVGTSGALGSAGSYLTGGSAGGTVERKQDVDISGYAPKNLTAILDFFVVNTGDAGDTITVELISRNAAGTTLQTQTYGPSDPGTLWFQNTLTISDLHDDTASLRVRVVMTPVGEFDTTANVGITEICLRVGQISSQLLSNPSFESGTTSWTVDSGSFNVHSTTKYESTNYIRPADGASAAIHQDVALPTGFEDGAAVLECARMNDAADDTGQVTLYALDSGGTPITSVASASEAISPSNAWQRRRLVLDPIPATATQLRVRFDAARVTGTPLNSCVDAFDLRCHKHLDPDAAIELAYDERVTQPLPRTVAEWKLVFPDVPAPDYAIFDGGLVGRLGVEPLMEADAAVVLDAKAVCHEDRRDATTCYEMPNRAEVDVRTSPIGTAFCNFAEGDPFSAMAFYKVGESPWTNSACGLMGRKVGARGWAFGLNDDGIAYATLYGSNSAKTIAGAVESGDGSLHGAGMIYDPATSFLRVVDGSGAYSVSTAGMGDQRAVDPGRFRLLRASDDDGAEPLPGQLVRAYVWRQALTTAEMLAVIRYNDRQDAWGTVDDYPRTGSIACVTGSDAEGVLVETFGAGRIAQAVDPASGELGLVAMPALTNLAPAAFGGAWYTEDATVTLRAAASPRGLREAAAIVDNGGGGYYLGALALGAAGARRVAWMARASAPCTGNVILRNASSATVDTTSAALTTAWQLFWWTAAWDGSTAGVGEVGFLADATETIYLCPIMFVGGTTAYPWQGTFPIGAPGATVTTLDTTELTAQFNREGELAVRCVLADADATLADLSNGADDHDRRTIRWNQQAVSDLESEHHNAAGTTDATANLVDTAIDEDVPFTARLRWNRAGLIDGLASAWSALRAEQGAVIEQDVGRGAVFTASTTVVGVLDLGHEGGGVGVMSGLIFDVALRTREQKV